jgi:class 3 adenylate cyclase/tetratricopeptide (TPR) repeat protein
MECFSCKADIPEGSRFCIQCGAPLPIVCPYCDSTNLPHAKFCAHCGNKLPAGASVDPSETVPRSSSTTAPEANASAERRQLTVVFCDLVGSTALASRLDPEDMRDVLAAYRQYVAETVTRWDGFVAKHMGDGVLAYFGYPYADEHDAERAVRASLALAGAVDQIHGSVELQVRIGISTGLVVVGDLVGSGEAQERGIVGETPNLAARLQALAEPGTVVIGPGTRGLLGDLFEYQDLGTVAFKGFSEPVRAYRVLRPSAVESRFEALHPGTLTPLVGREEEIELLLRRWRRAKCGEGQVVLLSGEPGIGKSRIAAALQEGIAAEPHVRLRYFCSPHHTESAFHPTIRQLERAAGFAHDDPGGIKLDKLQALLAPTASPRDDLALLADLLSLPTGDRFPPIDLTPQRKKERTFDALLGQFEALARRKPVLAIFEDAHWADPTSRELLDLFVDRVPRLRLLLLVTFRPEFQSPWTGQPHVTTMTLSRFGQRDGLALVARILGSDGALPAAIVEEIVERTDGVPLFLEELTKAVLETGANDNSARAVSTSPSPPFVVPATLYASLMARLDRLGPAAKEVAQIGAALGREFSHAQLAAVTGDDEAALHAALERLNEAGLVFRRGAVPHTTYLFKHALVQDAAYGTLLREPRRGLHGRIVDAFEARFPEIAAGQPEILAHHCTEAGRAEQAVSYRLTAGRRAVARSAMTEAAAHLRKGLDLLGGLPDGEWRQRQELELLVLLGQALVATSGFGAAAVGEAFARARQLCEQLDEPAAQFAPVLWGQWAQHLNRGEMAPSHHIAEQVLRQGEADGDPGLLAVGHGLRGVTRYHLGEFTESGADLEQAFALFDPAQRAFYAAVLPVDGHVAVQVYSSRNLVCLGYLDQAERRIAQALQEARQLSHAYTLAWALNLGWIGQYGIRSEQDLLRDADELMALTVEHGFQQFRAMAGMERGRCLAALGQESEGIAQFTLALAEFRALEPVSMLDMPILFALMADAHSRAGAAEAGLQLLAEAEHLVEKAGDCWSEAEIHRVRGNVEKRAGDRASAEKSFQRAIQVAQRQNARLFELRASTDLGQLWRDQERRDEALDLLAPVYAWFTEGFETPDLKQARMLLQELA